MRQKEAGGSARAGDAGEENERVQEGNYQLIRLHIMLLWRRWARLIQHVHQVDPLVCPKCGGLMKGMGFIETHQGAVIERIVGHCGLWRTAPPRPTPRAPPVGGARGSAVWRARPGGWPAGAERYREIGNLEPDFLEHLAPRGARGATGIVVGMVCGYYVVKTKGRGILRPGSRKEGPWDGVDPGNGMGQRDTQFQEPEEETRAAPSLGLHGHGHQSHACGVACLHRSARLPTRRAVSAPFGPVLQLL